jgi:hypothetical protein
VERDHVAGERRQHQRSDDEGHEEAGGSLRQEGSDRPVLECVPRARTGEQEEHEEGERQ